MAVIRLGLGLPVGPSPVPPDMILIAHHADLPGGEAHGRAPHQSRRNRVIYCTQLGSPGFAIRCRLTRGLGLLWRSCASARRFAPGFLQTASRDFVLAFR